MPKIPGTQMPSCFNNAARQESILAKMERSPQLPSQDDLKKFSFIIIFYKTSCKLISQIQTTVRGLR